MKEMVLERDMPKMTEPQKHILSILMMAVLLVSMFVIAREGAILVSTMQVTSSPEQSRICVVIDAGHGGNDPGKIGINGALEKEINLQIARKLQKMLEAEDIHTVMTRTDDGGLYDEGAMRKKVQDMKRRTQLIEQSDCRLVVSIHQNSYGQEKIQGAQVFYYSSSQPSKQLAELIQRSILQRADLDGTRVAKGNDDYYLLKKTTVPIVIVECGFLSNSVEANLLSNESYQEKMAWAIHMGILQYLSLE